MATADARAARERKQKIFVVVAGLALLGLLAIQLPRILGSSSSSAAPAAPTNQADQAPGPTAPSTSSAPVLVALGSSERASTLEPGKLRSFSAFARKDPFVQQVIAPTTGSTVGAGGGAGTEKPASQEFTVGEKPAAAVTVISINGNREALEPGDAFPTADPAFVLVAEQPKAKTATIGVAGGAYASGSRVTKLRVGNPLVLVNTATEARYRLVLVAVGSGEGKTSSQAGKDAPATKP